MKYNKYNIIEVVDGDSKHHLFDYYEVRDKLVELFGNPKNDEEHKILHDRIKQCMNNIPVFVIDEKKHKEVHKLIKVKKNG